MAKSETQEFNYKGKKYIKIGKNYWSADKYSPKEALAMSKTLKNCDNCLDCADCENCKDSTSCWDGKNLKDCVWCFTVVDAVDCFDCELGYKLSKCEGVYAGANLKHQDWSDADYEGNEGHRWRITANRELRKLEDNGAISSRNKKFHDLIFNRADKFVGKWGPEARPWKYDPSHPGYDLNQGAGG